MSEFTRNLIFRTDTNTIQGPVTILLTFDNKIEATAGLNQIAWRVINYGGGGQFASVNYRHDLIFASVQINESDLVTASANVAIGPGQRTTLIPSGAGVIFTPPTEGNPGQILAANSTGRVQGLAIGFFDARRIPQPLLVWRNVGNTLSVDAKFTPILMVYVTVDYQQTEVIRGPITSPVLLSKNLSLLPPEQMYTLKKNPDGSYSIETDEVIAQPTN